MSRAKKFHRRETLANETLVATGSHSILGDKRLRDSLSIVCGVIGGGVGAVAGYYLFAWLIREHNTYAIVLPAVFIGIGCGLGLRRRVPLMGLVCAISALVFTLLVEWQFFPFADDASLVYFLVHLTEKPPVKLGMFAIATILAGWFGSGRDS